LSYFPVFSQLADLGDWIKVTPPRQPKQESFRICHLAFEGAASNLPGRIDWIDKPLDKAAGQFEGCTALPDRSERVRMVVVFRSSEQAGQIGGKPLAKFSPRIVLRPSRQMTPE
jgi:hypothetical protein